MSITLKPGEFFGRAVAAGQCGEIALSETRYARGAFLPWHRHEEAYLTFVLAGGYRERLRGATRTCAPSTLVLHPAGDAHEDEFADRASRCLNVVLAPSFTRRLGAAGEALSRGGVVSGAVVANAGSRLAAELRRGDDVTALVVEGVLLELFGTLFRSEDGRISAWLREARTLIERRFAEKLTLATIAAEVGVHPVTLARTFRERFGVTVGEHVRVCRLAAAKVRIAEGAPLASVAIEAGFADQSHFTHAFTRLTGETPSAYRRRQKG